MSPNALSKISLLLLAASSLSAGIVSVNLVDVNASNYNFIETDVTVNGGTGRKLYGTADSGTYMFGFDRLWIDISVLNGTTSPWVELSWDFTVTRMPGNPGEQNFWFGVTDLDGNYLSWGGIDEGVEMSGNFYIPYSPEMNEAEVILNWWGTVPFHLDIPDHSIDFAPGTPPSVSAVPEPTTAGLALMALGGLAIRFRRR